MEPHPQQNDLVFTIKGAILGLFAYIALGLIITAVFM
jgi:hypothetical protein